MPKVGWTIDLKKCIGCRACYAACKAENQTPLRTDWRYVVERESGIFPDVKREWVSVACNHCDEPACLKACPADAISKRDSDGIVLIDLDKCIGCRYCRAACPYGAPRIDTGPDNDGDPDNTNKASKCTMCVHRLDAGAGLKPACQDACLTGAIQYEADFQGQTSDVPEGFADPALTKPNINFIFPD